jgi:hypothetical protein
MYDVGHLLGELGGILEELRGVRGGILEELRGVKRS